MRGLIGLRRPDAPVVVCIFAYCLVACLVPTAALAGEVKIVHINVGQGDATLILGPADSNGDRVSVLIDAGEIPQRGLDGGTIVRSALERHSVQRLNYFIATHYCCDHIGGVGAGSPGMHGHSFLLGPNGVPGAVGNDDGDGVIDWLDSAMEKPDPQELGEGDDTPVDRFVDRGTEGTVPDTAAYRKYVGMAEAAVQGRVSISSQSTVNSYEIYLGSDGGTVATMKCLAGNGWVRDRAQQVDDVDTENERSLCFLLSFGGFDYLIGGDVIGRTAGNENAKVEGAIGEYISTNGISVDVLQVNHHGADNTSDADFLADIAPTVAIISVGDNNTHHHPYADALDRLATANVVAIYQTERGETQGAISDAVVERRIISNGDIIVTSDGTSYEVTATRRFSIGN